MRSNDMSSPDGASPDGFARAGSSHEVGRRGEALAAAWYQANGYTVLDQNWRSRAGELDIIAAGQDSSGHDLVVFCEVKTRRTTRFGSGADAVDHRKRRKVRELAIAWLHASDVRYQSVRFDVAEVDRSGTVSVIEGCF